VSFMKILRTFMIVFVGTFLYFTFLHILSTPRINAQKAISATLSEFVNNKATTVKIIHFKDSNIAQTKDIQQGREVIIDLEGLLYRYVIKAESLTGEYNPPKEYIRLKLDNGKEQILLDFPTGESDFKTLTIVTKWSGNNGVYRFGNIGANKIKKFLLDKIK
jgi:hypothetical protein